MREVSGLAEALRNLDTHLLHLVSAVRDRTGREPGSDPFRGLYVSEGEVLQLLSDGQPVPVSAEVNPLAISSTFARLGEMHGLSPRDLDIVLIALAPELDSRYERIFAYLQDDVSRKRPSIELIASLFRRSPGAGSTLHAAGPSDGASIFPMWLS